MKRIPLCFVIITVAVVIQCFGMELPPLWLPASKLKAHRLPEVLPASWPRIRELDNTCDSPFEKRSIRTMSMDAKDALEIEYQPIDIDITVKLGAVTVIQYFTPELNRYETKEEFLARYVVGMGKDKTTHVPLLYGASLLLDALQNLTFTASAETGCFMMILSDHGSDKKKKVFQFPIRPTRIQVTYNFEKTVRDVKIGAIVVSVIMPDFYYEGKGNYIESMWSEHIGCSDITYIREDAKSVLFNIHIAPRELGGNFLYDIHSYL